MYEVKIKAGDLPARTDVVNSVTSIVVVIRDAVEKVLYNWLTDRAITLGRFQSVASTFAFFERDIDRMEDCEIQEALDEKGEWGYTLTHMGTDVHFIVTTREQKSVIELDGKAREQLTEAIKKEVKNQADHLINHDKGWDAMQDAMQYAVRETLQKAGYREKEIEKYIEDNFSELSDFGVRAEVDFKLD